MWIIGLIYALYLHSMEQLHNLEHFIIGFWESFIKYEHHESVTLNPTFCSN